MEGNKVVGTGLGAGMTGFGVGIGVGSGVGCNDGTEVIGAMLGLGVAIGEDVPTMGELGARLGRSIIEGTDDGLDSRGLCVVGDSVDVGFGARDDPEKFGGLVPVWLVATLCCEPITPVPKSTAIITAAVKPTSKSPIAKTRRWLDRLEKSIPQRTETSFPASSGSSFASLFIGAGCTAVACN